MAIKVNGKLVAGIGLPGKSAYQYAVDGGYAGTEEEFQEVLANAGGKPMVHGVTLSASAWAGNSQTITVPGVLADETKQLIQPVPAIASQAAYLTAGILCTGQAANNLTFTCQTVPEADLTVYVVITDVKS